jgi:colanic acid/amylovoran biosynthesis glycosyltransferase
MRQVQAEVPNAELVVIGDGPLRGGLESLARAELRQVRFLGAQAPETVRAWMNRARVFCVPSVTADTGATEGFGLVFAEAQAMGVPVAGFATGGVPEAVAQGETGFLVPERNVDQLARAIIDLLREDALWRRFSAAGQRRVEAHFNLVRQTERLEELYREVVTSAETSGSPRPVRPGFRRAGLPAGAR